MNDAPLSTLIGDWQFYTLIIEVWIAILMTRIDPPYHAMWRVICFVLGFTTLFKIGFWI